MSDLLIIGGGVIGLACALELRRRGASVTLLERHSCGNGASWAAAGMLAPGAEGLTGELANLAQKSLSLYPEWINQIWQLTGEECGYMRCGILAVGNDLTSNQTSSNQTSAEWLNPEELTEKQAGLSPNIPGAYWLEKEGQVDNRKLIPALALAARSLGVEILEGVEVNQIVTNIQSDQSEVSYLETSQGKIQSNQYLLATGAWTKSLLALPISPRKGQMLSLLECDRTLGKIIFGDRIYLVPRGDGRIIVGATVEDVGFLPGNTAVNTQLLLDRAIALYPAIADLPILDTWWGFRPYAPEEMPLLGASNYQNLALAVGHYRNGILLAPITAQILADYLLTK
jgi:glycine oxidase